MVPTFNISEFLASSVHETVAIQLVHMEKGKLEWFVHLYFVLNKGVQRDATMDNNEGKRKEL